MTDGGGDNISLLSSITTSDEEEKVVEISGPITPEIPVPVYKDEELVELVSFVQRMTLLFALNHKDWNAQTMDVIKQWFLQVNELILTIFYDGNVLTACLTFPLSPVYDLVYFLREPNQIFTVDGFHDEVIFGNIHEDVEGSLLSVMEKVYAPIFFRYEEWSENVKSYLCSALHNFLSFLTDLHYKISGRTVLYVPNEGHNLTPEKAVQYREMVKRIESVAVFWSAQIRTCLGDKHQLVPYDLLCPFDEFDFWLYRYEVLQGLYAQLTHQNIVHLINILQKVQSVHVKQIVELTNECHKEMDEAESNITYLQLLVDPCKDIDSLESPAQIPKQLPEIIHVFRYIWLKSKYYNTKEYITGLFRALSNQIIIYCRKQINIDKVLDGNPRFGIKMCDMAIDCCLSYKSIYEIMSKQHAEEHPDIGWELDNPSIFNHIDAFCKRLFDLIDICEAMIVFGRIDETEIINKPLFGGNRGPEFERICDEIEKLFFEGLNDIKQKSKNIILDVHNNKWYNEVVKYQKLVQDIEEIVENLVSNVFVNVCNVEEGVEALCTLYFFSYRSSLRKVYLRKTSEIWKQFSTEITDTNEKMLEQAKERLAWLPRYASKAITLKINLDRLTRLKTILDEAEWLPKVSQSLTAQNDFDLLHKNFTYNIKKIFNDWMDSLGFECLTRLDRSLIIRSETHPGLLECNIDRSVLEICEEARHFEILGFQIPANINQIYSKHKSLKFVYESVMTVVLDYNKILSALSKEERKLFNTLIVACDRKIMPGITKLTWGGEFSEAYISDCVKHTAGLQEFVDIYKLANLSIAQICEQICDTPILKLMTANVVELHIVANDMEKYKTDTTKKLLEYYNSIVELLAAVFKGFQPYIRIIEKDWRDYVIKFDRMLEEAFCLCVKNSLQSIHFILHGDGTMGPSPIISMEVDIKNDKIEFVPQMDDVKKFLGNILPSIIKALEEFPRLCEKFKLAVEEGSGDFHKVISENEGCQAYQKLISEEIDLNDNELDSYARNWSPYQSIWESDKELSIKKFEESNPMAIIFDEKLAHYADIANQISLHETITNVHFMVVNSNNLKNSIIAHVDEWQRRYTDLLKKIATEKIQDMYSYMTTNAELIMTTPRTISAMQESVKLYEKLLNERTAKHDEFPSIVDHFTILEKYEVPISSKLRQLVSNLEPEWESYLNKLIEAEEMLGTSKDGFKVALSDAAVELRNNVEHFQGEIVTTAPTFSNITPFHALKTIKDISKKLEHFYEIEVELISNLSILNIYHPENVDIRHMDKDMKLLTQVWNLVDEWETSWTTFKKTRFLDLVLDELEKTANRFFRQINDIYKYLKDKNWEILETKRRHIEDFRNTIPLIKALNNKAMRDRHWRKLKTIVQIGFNENSEDFNLEFAIGWNFHAYSAEIEDLSKGATMELSIENGIKNIHDAWQTITIQMALFNKEIYRIVSVEECFQILADNSVAISTMKATRFVEPFSKEVDYWERTLSYISETLEHALAVQKQWIYLNNIFTTDDIQKQLPAESIQFYDITEMWKAITNEMFKAQTALKATHFKPPPYLLEKLTEIDEKLESIQQSLEIYLEKKRQLFPRFYFISNDDLLEILGNAAKPDLVQVHLKKLFDNLYKLELKIHPTKKNLRILHGMFSEDGEYIEFLKDILVEGPSEHWLDLVEQAMRATLKDKLKQTRIALRKSLNSWDKWINLWPGQLCNLCAKIQWTSDCTRALLACKELDSKQPLKKFKKKQNNILSSLADLSRKDLPKLLRLKVSALITIEIHCRDVIDRMYKKHCTDVTNFEWLSQLRFHWDRDYDNCVIRQAHMNRFYGYEYTGNSGRLVITPLTDRCYITLTTALYFYRGGSPQGPAGTGKTETVKDLGKSLGMWVIVTNCSEGLDYKSIGKCFSGLAQTGAWGCFDEFNRINIEVLSVVAQQVSSILSALARNLSNFQFEGQNINLKPSTGLFITMNPGYAGRTELPDNLKSLFRKISMIVPDNVIIAENLLYSDGFENAKILARKVFILYDLAKQQLSKQNHYDFGLRSMVALLRYAGIKRRQLPLVKEEEIIYLAMKDMNIAKLNSDDLRLFKSIMSDIFPDTSIPVIDYSLFQNSIEAEMDHLGLQKFPIAINKVIELYETKSSRHSVMMLGETGAAKTTTWKILQGAYNRMKQIENTKWHVVHVYPINPKSLTLAELYGEYNIGTGEWYDGVLSSIMRTICQDESLDEKWLLFDGPVDAVWIENMNSLMDDNKVLTLVNSERIIMPLQVSLLFEVSDLSEASPATISRCGIIYNDYIDWSWRPYVNSWLSKQSPIKYVHYLSELFERYLDKILEHKRKCTDTVPISELNGVISLCQLLECFATKENGINTENDEILEQMTKLWFFFSVVWSICGCLNDEGKTKMDQFLREIVTVLPLQGNMYDYYVNPEHRSFIPWEDKLHENWNFNREIPFHKIFVPTIDTIRYEYLISKLIAAGKPVMLSGPVGTGKTSTASSILANLNKNKYSFMSINMTAKTTASTLQESIERHVEKKTKETYVPIGGKTMVCFLDDFNMPEKDTYGSQPPLELVRQWMDYGFWYNRKNQKRIYVKNVVLMGAMGPARSKQQTISARTLNRFSTINISFPTDATLTQIYEKMLRQKLVDFPEETKQLSKYITAASLDIFHALSSKMLPTPRKSHYLFNLRDISHVFQGLLRSDKSYHVTRYSMMRLWIHECFRVFSDRLVDAEDNYWFQNEINEEIGRYFDSNLEKLCPGKSFPLFGNFMSRHGFYEDLSEFNILQSYMEEQLIAYNKSPNAIRMDLVLFKDAIEHITRIARMLSQPRGHMLIISIGGSGRQYLSRLAAFICGHTIFQIEITQKYKIAEFREDLKTLYKMTGVDDNPTTFLLTGDQIGDEGFFEIINNILSTSEINLFKSDEVEEIIVALQPVAEKAGIDPTTDAIYKFFLERVRANLHVILCLSPIGNLFRVCIRQYPALVNCTAMDWFHDWPQEALLEVSRKFLKDCNLALDYSDTEENSFTENISPEEKLRETIPIILSLIHVSVTEISQKMLIEVKRSNFVTPVNFLELVGFFKRLLQKEYSDASSNIEKLSNGLFKIKEAQENVATLSNELKISQAQIIELQKESDEFLIILRRQRDEADEKQKSLAATNLNISREEHDCHILALQAQEELDQVLPALDDALKALDALNKKDLSELKSYGRPPVKVEKVLEAVMILLKKDPTWTESKRQLGEQNFLNDLRNYDKDNISDRILRRIALYTQDPELEPEKVGIVSVACKSLSQWIRAVENYGKVYRIVAPKKAKLAEALTSLKLKQELLEDAKRKFSELNSKLQNLQKEFDDKSTLQAQLREKEENLKKNLDRAVFLVDSFTEERLRWTKTVKEIRIKMKYLLGNCLLSSSFILYSGPFNSIYREKIYQNWRQLLLNNEILYSPDFQNIDVFCDPVAIREWNMQGLPSDDFSIENGVIIKEGTRWPLIIDPQSQAKTWIRNFEKNDLKIIDFGQSDYIKTLEAALQFGKPVLLHNVIEYLEPAITPILKKNIIFQSGQRLIKFNDKLITFHENFRFYITTKLQNPQFPPEVATKTTLVNFALKEKGLQDQLLRIIVRKEKSILEEQKDKLVVGIAKNRRELIHLENDVLRILNETRTSLLDDDELFSTLQASRQTSSTVRDSLNTAEVTEIEIDVARQGYQPIAQRAAILFFVIIEMAKIDPMYQFSLSSYIMLFLLSIERSLRSSNLNDRINNINGYHTYAVYRNICRGLFEKHKLLFSFHICTKILEADGKINFMEYNFLLRGGLVLDRREQAINPWPEWITESVWDNITELDKIPGCNGIAESFEQYPREWKEWYICPAPENEPLVGEWSDIFNDFKKMMLIRCLRPDRIIFCLTSFISNILAPKFVEPPILDLKAVLQESVSHTPLIFVLSDGVDPTALLSQLAEDNNMTTRFHSLSLGQGQSPIATQLLEQGSTDGSWVFLANCHLSLSWMPELDKIIETLQESKIHKKFRLWLSSTPHPDFPISILQSSIKMTTETPRGIKANMKRLYNIVTEEQFSDCPSPENYRKLLFSLCFFHTILLERKKFEQLGWNVLYSFNDSDFTISENILRRYLKEYTEIPWDALKYLIAEISYGGHVTDFWDRRLLTTYINEYFDELAITSHNYKLSSLTTYYIPKDGNLQSYKDYIEFLPNFDKSEAFGQHSNADISSLITETENLFDNLISLQGQAASEYSEQKEEQVLKLVREMQSSLPDVIEFENTEQVIESQKSPLDIVLMQEIHRYNTLLATVNQELKDLRNAIKGRVVMTAELEMILNTVFEGRVPNSWLKAYPSMKYLASWSRDLISRVEYFRNWVKTARKPFIFWLAAFTFPTGFLTAILQSAARDSEIPIDQLGWEFIILPEDDEFISRSPRDIIGAYVSGIFLEGAGWNRKGQCLNQPQPMELVTSMPLIHFRPTDNLKKNMRDIYHCPCYYYPCRSNSFITAIDLKSGNESAEYWIKRGTALLLSLGT